MGVPKSYKFSYFDRPWKHRERILCPDEFPRMRIKLADDLKLRPRNDRFFDIHYHNFPMDTYL